MSAIINHSYLDFFAIAVDAYNTDSKNIYRKLMMTIISTYKVLINDIEISSSALDNIDKLEFTEVELENFYEEIYDSIDIVKLYKSKLKVLNDKDILFTELYDVVNELHLVIVEYLDRVSTLEAKEIQKSYTQVA